MARNGGRMTSAALPMPNAMKANRTSRAPKPSLLACALLGCLVVATPAFAQSTGAKILPLHAQFSRCFQMKTWDGFIIPLPFSTVSINVGIPIRIPAEASHTEFECERNQLEEILKHGAN